MPYIDVNNLVGDDYARIALTGPEGSGKTIAALKLARGIVGPTGRIAVLDTENRSSRKLRAYEQFSVDTIEGNYSPAVYVDKIHDAEKSGFDALIVDSLTHAWNGPGGTLSIVDEFTGGDNRKNMNGWRKATPEHNRLVESLVHSKLNLLCTLRVKTEMEEIELPNGKKQWRKVGLMPIQRDGMMYEFDMVMDIDVNHVLTIAKTRAPMFDKQVLFAKQDKDLPTMDRFHRNLSELTALGEQIGEWLRTGIGKSRSDMVIDTIRELAALLGREEEAETLIEAADGDMAVLDEVLTGFSGGA